MNSQAAFQNMINQQLRTNSVLDDSILSLLEQIPRDQFVPEPFQHLAYSDAMIPLDHGQSMMTPLEEALLLQSLQLNGDERVLEIGTGSAYLTTLLAKTAGSVVSVDYFKSFTQSAEQKLAQHAVDNVELITGDASRGWMDKAPYDVIVITASLPQLHESFRPQLMKHGKLFAILGDSPVMQAQLMQLDHEERWVSKLIFETDIAPVIDNRSHKKFQF